VIRAMGVILPCCRVHSLRLFTQIMSTFFFSSFSFFVFFGLACLLFFSPCLMSISLSASAALLLSSSSLWKLIEACVSHFAFFSPLLSLLLLFLLVQHPRTFLPLLLVLLDLIILCVSSRIIEMEGMNCIIILLTYTHREQCYACTHPLVDLCASDRFLPRSLIAAAPMSIDPWLCVGSSHGRRPTQARSESIRGVQVDSLVPTD
jgi:hypothetical protein